MFWKNTDEKDMPQPNRWLSILWDEPRIDWELSSHSLLVPFQLPSLCAPVDCWHSSFNYTTRGTLTNRLNLSLSLPPPSIELGWAYGYNYFTNGWTHSGLPLKFPKYFWDSCFGREPAPAMYGWKTVTTWRLSWLHWSCFFAPACLLFKNGKMLQ